MLKIPVNEAVGISLCHDITRIVPGSVKERAFRRGHVIRPEDIEVLRDLGKEFIYVWHDDDKLVHEDEAAKRLVSAAAGPDFIFAEPNQGKVSIQADKSGLLLIDKERLKSINTVAGMVFATIQSGLAVNAGQTVAGVRVLPLAIEKQLLEQAEEICGPGRDVLRIRPFVKKTVGIVTTGNEVYTGRIQDGFFPVLEQKLAKYAANVLPPVYTPDDPEIIARSITECRQKGAEIICVTGGMSVDPDDVTPMGIRCSGAEVAFYGMPLLPGSMLMLAYSGETAICGLPGCVMFNKISTFDILLPYLFAGERLNREWAVSLGLGGMCLGCDTCRFPNCSFGRA